jgi:drug/metabolite transporter (DMT)-like permease
MDDGGYSPVEMYAYRFTAAYLLLLIFTCNKRLLSKSWRDELTFLFCGICAGSLYFITENFALSNTTVANVSMLASISPLFTTALLAVIFKMRIKGGVIAGSLLAFVGVGCIIFGGGEGVEIHPKGDILALCAAISWAVYSILVKGLLPVYNSFFITRKLFFYGVITSLPLLLVQEHHTPIAPLFDIMHPTFLLNFLFLVLICSTAAYLIWNESMKLLGSVTANNYLYATPLISMIAAAIVLNEPITLFGIIGCLLIIVGLYISDKLSAS